MSLASRTSAPIRHADRFYIGGQWVTPSCDATIEVIDPGTEELFFAVAEARAADSEGGREGLLPFLESKTVLPDGPTARYQGEK
jgi:hypothetical protein